MPRLRKFEREPTRRNFYLVDANLLANRFITVARVTGANERIRVQRSLDWCEEIDAQLATGRAFVYGPDLCIAEAFKVLAKKY